MDMQSETEKGELLDLEDALEQLKDIDGDIQPPEQTPPNSR